MKFTYLLISLLLVCSLTCYSQIDKQRFRNIKETKELTKAELDEQLTKYNFSKLLISTDNSIIYGFIGENYQRIRIKIISAIKNLSSPELYDVYGKLMVKNNIDEFHGTIQISRIFELKVIDHGCEDDSLYKGMKGEFSIIGSYFFSENTIQQHAGVFKGTFRSDYFLNRKNNVEYDNIEDCSDGFTNNQFTGTWTSYKSGIIKKCNWGDYRIPNSGDLDIGAGEFSPNEKYLQYGWQIIRDYSAQSGTKHEKAKRIEEAKWWE